MKFIRNGFLSSNNLKIIACISMLIDHIGYFLFPSIYILRVIGRIAFPIFAYLIAKGCIYTRNKLKRFLTIFILGLVCEIVVILSGNTGNILLTFSLSILLIYLYQAIIKSLEKKKFEISLLLILCLGISLLVCYFINLIYYLDYGFMGVIAPLIVSVFSLENYKFKDNEIMKYQKCFDILALFIALTLVIVVSNSMLQMFSYFSLLFVIFYNNKRGKYNLKYLFYIFYPLHIAFIYLFTLI